MDHMHTAVLHNHMVVEGVDAATSAGVSLEGFGDMPVMQWEATRDGNGCVFIASRRLPGDKIWVRITEMVFPNYLQIGSLLPTAARERHGTAGCTRWNVPVDDENMIIFGYRHFNSTVDPDSLGNEADCGVDKIDFLEGQTGNRSYDEGQRAPGDWEAIVSQGRIAAHGAEHPGVSDVGVYMCLSLIHICQRGDDDHQSAQHHQVPGLRRAALHRLGAGAFACDDAVPRERHAREGDQVDQRQQQEHAALDPVQRRRQDGERQRQHERGQRPWRGGQHGAAIAPQRVCRGGNERKRPKRVRQVIPRFRKWGPRLYRAGSPHT